MTYDPCEMAELANWWTDPYPVAMSVLTHVLLVSLHVMILGT